MTPHVVECADCSFDREFDDFEAATEALEDHAQSEVGHAVTLKRARAVTDGGEDRPTPIAFDFDAVVHGAEVNADCLALTNSGKPCTNRAYDGNDLPVCNTHASVDDPDVVEDAHQWARISDDGRTITVCVNCRDVWDGKEPETAVACRECGADPGQRCRDETSTYAAPIPPHPQRRQDAYDTLHELVPCPENPACQAQLVADGGLVRQYYLMDSSREPRAVVAGPFDDQFDAIEEREHREGDDGSQKSLGLWTRDSLRDLAGADGWELEWEIDAEDVPEWAQDEPRVATDGGRRVTESGGIESHYVDVAEVADALDLPGEPIGVTVAGRNIGFKIPVSTDGGGDAPAVRLFICTDCGTTASTNSGKKIVDSDVEPDLEAGGVNEDAVVMRPPCPCGNDVFNPREFLVLEDAEDRYPVATDGGHDIDDAGYPGDVMTDLGKLSAERFQEKIDEYGAGKNWLQNEPWELLFWAIAEIVDGVPEHPDQPVDETALADAINYIAFAAESGRHNRNLEPDGGETGEDHLPDAGVAAAGGYVCQNFPEHPGEEVKMGAGPYNGVRCPECGRMANGPDDEIPFGDPPGPDGAAPDGDVPEDGSGIDGVWTDQIPDAVDDDQEWFIAVNGEDEKAKYELPNERVESIDAFNAHFWNDVELVVPAAIMNPYAGRQLHSERFEGTVEDRAISSIEAVLDELDFEYEDDQEGSP